MISLPRGDYAGRGLSARVRVFARVRVRVRVRTCTCIRARARTYTRAYAARVDKLILVGAASLWVRLASLPSSHQCS